MRDSADLTLLVSYSSIETPAALQLGQTRNKDDRHPQETSHRFPRYA